MTETYENYILNEPFWQTIGSPLLSDEEGFNRAYSNSQNLYYDGNETYIQQGLILLKTFLLMI